MRGFTVASDAVTTAAETFQMWSSRSRESREAIVRRYAAEVQKHAPELVQLLMTEVRKLRRDAESEVAAVISKAEISIEMQRSRRPDVDTTLNTMQAQVRYRPLGVVLVLGPFNFPAHLPGGHIIPALLAGNTVVFKPSEFAPLVGQWVCDRWQQAGLPDGALTLLQGDANVAKTAIDDPRIAGVFFTGGHRAGVAIHRQLAGRPECLLALEMGGMNPLIVAPPYNIPHAISVVAESAFVSAGQRCTCTRRLIVVDGPQTHSLLEGLVQRVASLKLGLPFDEPAAEIGPVIHSHAAERLLQTQADWMSRGGRPLLELTPSPRDPALLHPGIIDMTDATGSDEQEWFGPLLQVYRVSDVETALRIANATPFGLAASLITDDRAIFEAGRQTLRAGIINWNLPTTGANSRLPFGGLGASGNHRPAGAFAIDCCNDPVASLLQNPSAG